MTSKEYQILELLSLRKGSTLTKEMFLNNLYGGMDEPEAKIIDVFICKLRKKLATASRAWIPEPSATGLREADLNVLAKLGEQGLEWRLEAEAFARREVCGEDDLLDFLFGHSVDIQVTRQPST